MSSNEHRLVQCNEKDQEALLNFKKGINDSIGQLSTWLTEKDCCAWEGVHCDNITGRVTELHISQLQGEMNLSILELEFLTYLDLSEDVINISSTQHNFTHTSNLFYLDLFSPFGTLQMENLDWLSPLSSLKYLNLSGIDLHKETNWFRAVNTLSSLLELHLSHCNLNNLMFNPSIEYLNLSSLVTLDLSENNFTSQSPNSFFNLTKDLTYLDLHWSNIHGEIPSSLLNLKKLRFLDLSSNQLQGSIPDGIGQLPNIQHLDLSVNQLKGSIPSTAGNLSSLHYLDIGLNNFSGGLPNIPPNAIQVDLSYNSFSGSIPHNLELGRK
ncbi:receptor-like protein kinase [Trifolium pratense]|uniref:Receptor-like protein kinase n=1 Tax=Trifolium pratense TaxID=57577 RepID=A0A2K3L1K8_TRIPR|nr:receptor-like protein kinase [Trifolium pratense]